MPEITIPCRLPSLGRLYKVPIPNGDIQITPIRGEQEELLAGAGQGVNAAIMLREVTKQLSVLPEGFPFPELLVSDWVAITFNIMAASYSPDLTLTPPCPACSFVLQETKNLSQLECVTADSFEEGEEGYKEPFVIEELPLCKQRVEFRLLRLRDLQRIEEYSAQAKRKQAQMKMGDPTYTFTLASHIHSIDGNSNMSDLDRMRWVRKCIARDLHVMRHHIDAKETGFNLRPEFSCPSCGNMFRAQVPLDFFRSFSSQT